MTLSDPVYGDEPGFGPRSPLLYSVVYCSRARAGVDTAVVQDLVARARTSNATHGVTGLLVFGSGIFFQWLEGPREPVLTLMGLLRRDPRHEDIVQLGEAEEARERLFPDWDMELVGGEHIREVLQDALDSATDTQHQQTLTRLLADVDSGPLGRLAAD